MFAPYSLPLDSCNASLAALTLTARRGAACSCSTLVNCRVLYIHALRVQFAICLDGIGCQPRTEPTALRPTCDFATSGNNLPRFMEGYCDRFAARVANKHFFSLIKRRICVEK